MIRAAGDLPLRSNRALGLARTRSRRAAPLEHALRGIPCLKLEELAPPKQQIMASRSFGRVVTELEALKQAVATHTAHAAVKLRRQHSTAQALLVFIQTNSFREQDPQYHNACTLHLPAPTCDTGKLIAHAIKGVEAIYRKGFRYHKAGILLMNLAPEGRKQLDLVSHGDDERARQRMVMLDHINAVMGRGTLRFAGEGLKQSWAVRQGRRSPAYTTRWDELPEVK